MVLHVVNRSMMPFVVGVFVITTVLKLGVWLDDFRAWTSDIILKLTQKFFSLIIFKKINIGLDTNYGNLNSQKPKQMFNISLDRCSKRQ